MEIKYFPEGDVLTVLLNDNPPTHGKCTEYGVVDYSEDGAVCRIKFINASVGVNVDTAPEEAQDGVALFLNDNDLVPVPVEEWAHSARRR